MSKVEVKPDKKDRKKLDKAKEVVKKHWKPFAVGVGVTVVTIIVTKRVTVRYLPIEGTTTVISKAVVKDNGSLYNVFNIYGHGFKHQGPSWMVKCVENGRLYRSQKHAAKVLGLSREQMSKHLNPGPNQLSNVGGYHFERIGIGT